MSEGPGRDGNAPIMAGPNSGLPVMPPSWPHSESYSGERERDMSEAGPDELTPLAAIKVIGYQGCLFFPDGATKSFS